MMTAASVCSGLGSPPAWAATMDVAGRYTAVIVGAMNMAGTAGGFLLPVVLGYMIGDISTDGGRLEQHRLPGSGDLLSGRSELAGCESE